MHACSVHARAGDAIRAVLETGALHEWTASTTVTELQRAAIMFAARGDDAERAMSDDAFFSACAQLRHLATDAEARSAYARALANTELACTVTERLERVAVPTPDGNKAALRDVSPVDCCEVAQAVITGGTVIVHAPTQCGAYR